MGETGLLTLDMLEREGVLAAGGFVGVDLDPARIDGFRRSRPDLKWIAGNLYEHLHAPEMANVGVLNLDEYGEIGSRSAETDFPLIHGLVRRGLERFGEFALFWNQDLDSVSRRRQNRGEALRRHADMVASVLQGCLPRRELTSAMLLPTGSEADIDGGFIGVLGAFEIYRGSERAAIAWRTCGSSCGNGVSVFMQRRESCNLHSQQCKLRSHRRRQSTKRSSRNS